MKLGNIWDEVYLAYAMCGVRLGRVGVTRCRTRVYDYDEKAWYAWRSWTQR